MGRGREKGGREKGMKKGEMKQITKNRLIVKHTFLFDLGTL
jgi:hypothetical protein